MINFVSIRSPRATVSLHGYLSWASSHKGVNEAILFPSVTPYFSQITVPGVCYGNYFGPKVGSHIEPHSSWSSSIKVKKVSDKIFNFAKGNSKIKSMTPSWCELSRSKRNSQSFCYFKLKDPVSWQTDQNQPERLMKCYKSGNQTIDITEMTNYK